MTDDYPQRVGDALRSLEGRSPGPSIADLEASSERRRHLRRTRLFAPAVLLVLAGATVAVIVQQRDSGPDVAISNPTPPALGSEGETPTTSAATSTTSTEAVTTTAAPSWSPHDAEWEVLSARLPDLHTTARAVLTDEWFVVASAQRDAAPTGLLITTLNRETLAVSQVRAVDDPNPVPTGLAVESQTAIVPLASGATVAIDLATGDVEHFDPAPPYALPGITSGLFPITEGRYFDSARLAVLDPSDGSWTTVPPPPVEAGEYAGLVAVSTTARHVIYAGFADDTVIFDSAELLWSVVPGPDLQGFVGGIGTPALLNAGGMELVLLDEGGLAMRFDVAAESWSAAADASAIIDQLVTPCQIDAVSGTVLPTAVLCRRLLGLSEGQWSDDGPSGISVLVAAGTAHDTIVVGCDLGACEPTIFRTSR